MGNIKQPMSTVLFVSNLYGSMPIKVEKSRIIMPYVLEIIEVTVTRNSMVNIDNFLMFILFLNLTNNLESVMHNSVQGNAIAREK